MGKTRVRIDSLEPGMVVASDILNLNGTIIIGKKTILDKEKIHKLQQYPLSAIFVKTESDESGEEQVTIKSLETIKNTDEFKYFKKMFDKTKEDMKSTLNEIVCLDKKVDIKKMITDLDNIISEIDTGTELFDMLNCMKDDNDEIFTHSLNVALISNMIGKWAKLPKSEIDLLGVAALLHDIGKLKLPQEILHKTTPLTSHEKNIMQKHAVYGYNTLKDKGIEDSRIYMAALSHHERYDGSGYPLAKKKNEIDDFSKVIAIADVYDNMTSPRSYRHKISPFKVIHLLETDGYQKFDTSFLLTFLSGILDTFINYSVELSTKEVGKIIFINKSNLSRPMVKVGKKYIDLSVEKDIDIVKII